MRRLLGNYIVSALAKPGYEPATHRLWLIGTAILGQIGAAASSTASSRPSGAVFAGPTAPAVWLRERLAPVLNERQGIVWGVVSFVYLLAILWGGTHALRTWWGILLLAGLIAIGVYALRRQTLTEFPSGAALEPAPAGAGGSASAELSRLHALHEAGDISDGEFVERAKKISPTT